MTLALVWTAAVLGLVLLRAVTLVVTVLERMRDVEDEGKLAAAEELVRPGLSRGQARRYLVGDDWG